MLNSELLWTSKKLYDSLEQSWWTFARSTIHIGEDTVRTYREVDDDDGIRFASRGSYQLALLNAKLVETHAPKRTGDAIDGLDG
jgi:hypothetical protein